VSAALVQRISGKSAFEWSTSLSDQTSVRLNVAMVVPRRHGPELDRRSFQELRTVHLCFKSILVLYLRTYVLTYLLTVERERSWSGAGAEREQDVKKYGGAGTGGRVSGSGAVRERGAWLQKKV